MAGLDDQNMCAIIVFTHSFPFPKGNNEERKKPIHVISSVRI